MDNMNTFIIAGLLLLLIQVASVLWLRVRSESWLRRTYDEELGRLTAGLQQDMERKISQYDGKLGEYKRYMAIMHRYSHQSKRQLFDRCQQAMVTLMENPDEQGKVAYIQSILTLQHELTELHATFRIDLGGMRLEASDELTPLLEEYLDKQETAHGNAAKVLSWLIEQADELLVIPEAVEEHIHKLRSIEFDSENMVIVVLQEAMLRAMRNELRGVDPAAS